MLKHPWVGDFSAITVGGFWIDIYIYSGHPLNTFRHNIYIKLFMFLRLVA